jgi:hypothetical protein
MSVGEHPGVRSLRAAGTEARRERALTDIFLSEPASTVEGRQRPIADLTTPPGRRAPKLLEPLGDSEAPAAAHAAVPREVVGEPQPTKRFGKLPRAYSFIGGLLMGISISLPLLLDAGEGGSALVVVGSLTLAAAGIGMHVRGAKQICPP